MYSLSRRKFIAISAGSAFAVAFSTKSARTAVAAEEIITSQAEATSPLRVNVNGQTSLWFVPHQDDEVLTLGGGIIDDILEGYNVHLILCTDGNASVIRKQLKSGKYCSICGQVHNFHLSVANFIDSRDTEFLDSCASLGIPQTNIHIVDSLRMADNEADEETAKSIIVHYLNEFPGSKINAISPLSTALKDTSQSCDHFNIGNALVSIEANKEEYGVNLSSACLFLEPYCYSEINEAISPAKYGDNHKLNVSALECECQELLTSAMSEYKLFSPENNRYAIGYHSVHNYFENPEMLMTVSCYRSKMSALQRFSGNTRFDTMKMAVLATWSSSEYAIVVSGKDFPDALSAASLAGSLDAPILTSNPDNLPQQTQACLQSLNVKNVIIVGGIKAISTSVEKTLGSLCQKVERISGADRHDTSNKIANKVVGLNPGATEKCCIVANGYSFADALSISSYSFARKVPIFLTNQDGLLNTSTVKTIRSIGFNQLIIVGGTSVVKDDVASQCKISNVTRLGGNTRFGTSALCTEYAVENGLTFSGFSFCSGLNFPDALVAGPCAGKHGSVVVLVRDSYWDCSPTLEMLAKHSNEIDLDNHNCYAFGGTAAISNALAQITVLAATNKDSLL